MTTDKENTHLDDWDNDTKLIAVFLHQNYEFFSKQENWETQKSTRKSFNKLPIENQRAMLRIADLVNNQIKRARKETIEEEIKFLNEILPWKSRIKISRIKDRIKQLKQLGEKQ